MPFNLKKSQVVEHYYTIKPTGASCHTLYCIDTQLDATQKKKEKKKNWQKSFM